MQNISWIVDLVAINQRQLGARPAEKRLLILAKIPDRIDLKLRVPNLPDNFCQWVNAVLIGAVRDDDQDLPGLMGGPRPAQAFENSIIQRGSSTQCRVADGGFDFARIRRQICAKSKPPSATRHWVEEPLCMMLFSKA